MLSLPQRHRFFCKGQQPRTGHAGFGGTCAARSLGHRTHYGLPTPDWNPALYRRREGQRTRSAQELLAHVPLTIAALVVDPGCRPVNSTKLRVQRFAQAQVTGIDHSQAMLDSACKRLPATRFLLGDIATWAPATLQGAAIGPLPDLVFAFANAALHWVPGHSALVPRFFAVPRCVAQAYLIQTDGQRLLALPRLFTMAQR